MPDPQGAVVLAQWGEVETVAVRVKPGWLLTALPLAKARARKPFEGERWWVRLGTESREAMAIELGPWEETPWVLLELPEDPDSACVTLHPRIEAGDPCQIITPGESAHPARVAASPFVAPADPVLLVRAVSPQTLPAGRGGAPILQEGRLIGLLNEAPLLDRPHLHGSISAASILDRSARLRSLFAPEALDRLLAEEHPLPAWPDAPPQMVGWFDPDQLFNTAANVAISAIFGQFDDFRSTEQLFAERTEVALDAASDKVEALWIDYVADTGDGWNPVYAVASAASLPNLPLRDPEGRWHNTMRGHILVFGGDQVYPIATPEEYRDRFVKPWRLAASGRLGSHRCGHPWRRPVDGTGGDVDPFRPHHDFVGNDDDLQPTGKLPPRLPWVLAIPGNHDWYDNLNGFMGLFCKGERFAEWNPVQSRSYFAARLPWGWWLFGVDIQLKGDLDQDQLAYFLERVNVMGEPDKVILCAAEPWWIHETRADRVNPPHPRLQVLVDALNKGDHLRLYLAGDLHHYRRHADGAGVQKITAGGGGAFLHPTHPAAEVEILPRRPDGTEEEPVSPEEFTLRASYPTPKVSEGLAWRNFFFGIYNWRFGLLTAGLYLLGAWMLTPLTAASKVSAAKATLAELPALVLDLTRLVMVNPVSGVYFLAIVAGFRAFSNTNKPVYNWVAGLLHGVAHVLGIFGVYTFAAWYTTQALDMDALQLRQLLLSAAIVAGLGGFVGTFLMGAYLFISNVVFHRHPNEAFSSLKIDGWKNFVRLRLERDRMVIYPVGFDKVPRRWAPAKDEGGPVRWPTGPEAEETRPRLIESPIIVERYPKRTT